MGTKFDTLTPEQQAAVNWKADEHCRDAHTIPGEIGSPANAVSDTSWTQEEYEKTRENIAGSSPDYIAEIVAEHKASFKSAESTQTAR